jgi:hypothetical protein
MAAMRNFLILLSLVAAALTVASRAQAERAAASHAVTKQDVDRDMKELSNWGPGAKMTSWGRIILVPDVVEPIHQSMLIAMGVNLFDNCDLEVLAAACAQHKKWTFLLTANPLAVPAGTGSPVNPVAVF